ncbi:MAG: serine hydrolase [Polyangiaceae bacterium]|nr:serine hydrolase [Polyangiaceae bacterium]
MKSVDVRWPFGSVSARGIREADLFFEDLMGPGGARGGVLRPELLESAAEASPTRVEFLAELPHDLGALDPGIFNADESLKVDAALQASLDAELAAKPSLGSMGIAVVDLTTATPRLAGHESTVMSTGASVPKIAAMYAAHQLLHDLNQLASAKSLGTVDQVFAAAKAEWLKTQAAPATHPVPIPAAPLRGAKRLFRHGKLILVDKLKVRIGRFGLARLDSLFESAGGNPIQLKFKSTGQAQIDLERIDCEKKKATIDALGFAERMKLMISWSNNYAASTCIHDVGYLYIASVLLQSGLYHPLRGGGLWLGSDYAGGVWRRALLGIGGTQSTSAIGLAAFMTMLARDQLQGSARMRRLLGSYRRTRSPLADPVAPDDSLSKIGLLSGKEMDVAFIEKAAGATTLRYVAAALNGTSEKMDSLSVALKRIIRSRNGVP